MSFPTGLMSYIKDVASRLANTGATTPRVGHSLGKFIDSELCISV